tara:strand:+ start:244 stop:780 length:537 start_codon:yes stop_codon:yes gene_type:complete
MIKSENLDLKFYDDKFNSALFPSLEKGVGFGVPKNLEFNIRAKEINPNALNVTPYIPTNHESLANIFKENNNKIDKRSFNNDVVYNQMAKDLIFKERVTQSNTKFEDPVITALNCSLVNPYTRDNLETTLHKQRNRADLNHCNEVLYLLRSKEQPRFNINDDSYNRLNANTYIKKSFI